MLNTYKNYMKYLLSNNSKDSLTVLKREHKSFIEMLNDKQFQKDNNYIPTSSEFEYEHFIGFLKYFIQLKEEDLK